MHHRKRKSSFLIAAFLLALLPVSGWAGSGLRPIGEAPRTGMINGRWAAGNKQIFGTAYESYDSRGQYSASSPTAPISKVWFTGAEGVLTEVYWPTIDRPQVRDSQFLVTDGSTFFFEERKNADSTVRWVKPGVPAYVTVNEDPENRFTIERTTIADPDRDVVLQKIRIVTAAPGLKFYYLHNPSAGNSSLKDYAFVSRGEAPGEGMYAWEGSQAQAVVFSLPLKQVSAGFEGANDGYQDLYSDLTMHSSFAKANDGNVVMMAWLDLPETPGVTEFEIALGFGTTIASAYRTARTSLDVGFDQALRVYSAQWDSYRNTIRDLSRYSTDHGQLYFASLAILKSSEDKTYEGAFIASPSIPWGQHIEDRPENSGGYHLVWPRDLYQVATGLLAVGDQRSALACLEYLKGIQYGQGEQPWSYGPRSRSRDGSFPQNTWVNGDEYWGGLQMDQTAFPIILAYRLWQADVISLVPYWSMVRRAADFIVDFGPWTAQERWEENHGASPSTIAAEIAALWVAAEMAEAANDLTRAKKYRATADAWSFKPDDHLETWTFTTQGSFGNGKYFTRIEAAASYDQTWDPNDGARYHIANDGGQYAEKDVTDGGFLELVRLGVRRAQDYHVMESLAEYDQTLMRMTPMGPGFYRYRGDRYGRDDSNGAKAPGMLWPLLTGERGQYELAKALESAGGTYDARSDSAVVPYIRAIERFATGTQMIPEQVWDPSYGRRVGRPTGSATPLAWAHSEYIKLLSARQQRRLPDQIPAVRERLMELEDLSWTQIRDRN